MAKTQVLGLHSQFLPEAVKCSYCRSRVEATSRYCPFCGIERTRVASADFDTRCSFCGATVVEGSEYCRICGALIHFDASKVCVQRQYYPDFGSCGKCEAINFIGQGKCSKCGFEGRFRPLHEKASITLPLVFWLGLTLLAILLAAVTFGLSLVVVVISIFRCFKLARESKEREISRQQQADYLLAQTLQAHGRRASATYRAARLDIEAVDFPAALQKLDKCKELGIPSDVLAEGYAFAHSKNGDPNSAIPFLERHAAKRGDTDIFHEMLIEAYLADGLRSDKAIQFCLDTYNHLRPDLRQRAVFRLASLFAKTRRNDDAALHILKEADENDPTDPRHIAGIASVFNSQGKPQDAIESCSSFRGEHSKESLGEFTRALDALNRIDDVALQVYRRRLVVEPTDSCARLRLCQGLVRASQLTDAIDIFREGLIVEPANLRLRYHLALTLLKAGNIEGAIGECQQLMHQPSFETYKSRSELHLLLGKCFVTKKLFSPALKQYRLAGQATEVMERLYELGEVAESMGDSQTAKQCWEEICTVDINFKDVKGKVA